MWIKKLIINSGTITCLVFGKLSKATTTTLIIERLPISNHFVNMNQTSFFPIRTITLIR